MFREDGGRPADERRFVHKRIFGAAKGFVTSGFNPLAAVGGFLGAGGRKSAGGFDASRAKFPARDVVPRELTERNGFASEQTKAVAKLVKFNGGGGAPPGPLATASVQRRACPNGLVLCKGNCVSPQSPFGKRCLGLETLEEQQQRGGGRNGRFPSGDAVMGQFGAALEPVQMQIERSVCRPGMVLGLDELCYNKGSISNSQRLWPRGRRPLLTGGDMHAISIAARAGAKLERTTKRLRTLGMMKRTPTPRKLPAHQHAKALPAVSVS